MHPATKHRRDRRRPPWLRVGPRRKAATSLPAHSLAETLDRLESLFFRVQVSRLVVAGDLVETPRFCRRTGRDIQALSAWLERARSHARPPPGQSRPARRAPPARVAGSRRLDPLPRPSEAARTQSDRRPPSSGHQGRGGHRALLSGRRVANLASRLHSQRRGLERRLGGVLPPAPFWKAALRAIVATGADWLDFGPIENLARRLSR